jgi:hypothetical protein
MEAEVKICFQDETIITVEIEKFTIDTLKTIVDLGRIRNEDRTV